MSEVSVLMSLTSCASITHRRDIHSSLVPISEVSDSERLLAGMTLHHSKSSRPGWLVLIFWGKHTPDSKATHTPQPCWDACETDPVPNLFHDSINRGATFLPSQPSQRTFREFLALCETGNEHGEDAALC